MQIEFGMSQEEVLRLLIAEAKSVWGAERMENQRQAIGITAERLWQLYQNPLDITEEALE